MIAAAHGPSALWYATRGTGAVTLVLLTASVAARDRRERVLAAGRARRASRSRRCTGRCRCSRSRCSPSTSGTTAARSVPAHRGRRAVVPFATAYRPLWLGLGTVAVESADRPRVTSLVRRRLGYGAWRGLHWLAYACWPVALLHGIGTGSDAKIDVDAGAHDRLRRGGAGRARRAARRAQDVRRACGPRGRAAVVLVAARAGGLAHVGPLAIGWARRAGTPAKVLAAFSAHATPAARPGPDAGRRDRRRLRPGLLADAARAHPRGDGVATAPRSWTCACARRRPARRAAHPSRRAGRCPAAGSEMDAQRGDARAAGATRRATAGGSRSSTTPCSARWSDRGRARRAAPHRALAQRRRGRRRACAESPVAAMSLPRLLAGVRARPRRCRWTSTSGCTARPAAAAAPDRATSSGRAARARAARRSRPRSSCAASRAGAGRARCSSTPRRASR